MRKPSLLVIFLTVFLDLVGFGIVLPLLPIYSDQFGAGGLFVGVIMASFSAMQFLCAPAWGRLSDRIGRKGMIVGGMLLQGVALGLVPLLHGFGWWALTMALLGLGTALVYPTLLAAVSDVAHPNWRASAVGVYRLWRDSGYALGALLAGVLADLFGVPWAIGVIAALTVLSGVIAQAVMAETLPRLQHTRQGQLETKEA